MGDETVAHDLATQIEPADMEQLFFRGHSFMVTGEDGHELFLCAPGLEGLYVGVLRARREFFRDYDRHSNNEKQVLLFVSSLLDMVPDSELKRTLLSMLEDTHRLPGQRMEDFMAYMEDLQSELLARTLRDADPSVRAACEDAVIDGMDAVQRVRLAVKVLMENGQEDAALRIMNYATTIEVLPCTVADVRSWFDQLRTADKYPQIERLVVLAIRAGVRGLTIEDVRYWVQILFENKESIHAGPMVSELIESNRMRGLSNGEILGFINELFSRNCPTGAIDIAVLALENDYLSSEIKEDDVRQWMELLFENGKYRNVARLGSAVLNRRAQFNGITDEEVLAWIRKCRDFTEVVNGFRVHTAADSAGFLQISAYANGVQGISKQDIAKMITEVFDVDVFTENTSYAMDIEPLLTAAMTMKGVTVDDFPVAELLETGDDRMIIRALTAIECGLPGVDSTKIKEWLDICLKWKWGRVKDRMEYGAAKILAKAYEKNMPGLDAFCDPLVPRFGEHTFLELGAYIVLSAALGSNYIETPPVDMIRSSINNSVNSGYASGMDQFVVPVIRRGVEGLQGGDVIGWVNTLLEKGVEERKNWQKRFSNLTEEDRQRESMVPIIREGEERLAAGLHKRAYDVLIAGLDTGMIDGITAADILRVKKALDELGRVDQGMEVLIAAKEAGIDILESDILANIADYYASGSGEAAATGALAAKLFAMYDRHSHAVREHPELIAVIAGLSDAIGAAFEESATSPENVPRETVAEAVRVWRGRR